jgi:hypothetical protein
VDYVVPIITDNYLKAVSTRDSVTGSSLLCMDTKYIKYIYTLMTTYYLRNGCINDRIRCVVPDSLVHLTQRHPIMARPLFEVWVPASGVEQLCLRMLRSRFWGDGVMDRLTLYILYIYIHTQWHDAVYCIGQWSTFDSRLSNGSCSTTPFVSQIILKCKYIFSHSSWVP